MGNTVTRDPITGLASSNTQNPTTGVVTSNPITPESLTTPAALKTVTPTPDTTNYAGIASSASQSVIDDYTSLNEKYKTASTDLTRTGEGVIDDMTALKDKAKDTVLARETAGVNLATDEVNKYITQLAELNGQATSLNREAQAIPVKVQQNNLGTGATDAGVAPQEAGALRLNALKALSIAQQSDVVSAALTGSQVRLKAAEDKAKQIIDLKYTPLEQGLAIRTKQYELNKDTLSLIDKSRTEALGLALQKEKDELTAKKDLETKISTIQLEAAKNSATPEIMTAIQGAKSVGDAIKAAGTFLAAPNTEVVKVGENSAFLIDKTTGKIIKSYAGTPSPGSNSSGIIIPPGATPTVSALGGLVGLVPNFPSVTAQKVFATAINDLAKKPGNEKAIAEKIIGQTVDNIKDEAQRKIVGGNFAISQEVTRLQGLLDDYVASGGKTDWIKGKTEDTYQFVGKTSDPEIAKIGVQIALTLDTLARLRTGAVVTTNEERAFGKMLPGKGKTPDLNTAITSGLKTSMMSTVENNLRFALTSDGVSVLKATLPEVFGDYRSANPTIQLKAIYNSSPALKTQIDQMQKEHPEWTASDIMQIINGK